MGVGGLGMASSGVEFATPGKKRSSVVTRKTALAALAQRFAAQGRGEESLEGRLKRVEEALDSLRTAVRDLAADLRR